MDETISFPPGIVMTTSVLTGPFFIVLIIPLIWFRALIFMVLTNDTTLPDVFNIIITRPGTRSFHWIRQENTAEAGPFGSCS